MKKFFHQLMSLLFVFSLSAKVYGATNNHNKHQKSNATAHQHDHGDHAEEASVKDHCDCGCAKSGACDCGEDCPCDCGCGETGTCDCGSCGDGGFCQGCGEVCNCSEDGICECADCDCDCGCAEDGTCDCGEGGCCDGGSCGTESK